MLHNTSIYVLSSPLRQGHGLVWLGGVLVALWDFKNLPRISRNQSHASWGIATRISRKPNSCVLGDCYKNQQKTNLLRPGGLLQESAETKLLRPGGWLYKNQQKPISCVLGGLLTRAQNPGCKISRTKPVSKIKSKRSRLQDLTH